MNQVAKTNEILTMRANGASYDAIRSALGVSNKRIARDLRKRGMLKKPRVGRIDIDAVSRLKAQGKSTREIADKIGVHVSSLYSALSRRGKLATVTTVAEDDGQPAPVMVNGVDVADVEWRLDRGERLSDIALDYGCKHHVALINKVADKEPKDLEDARRRLAQGERPASVAFRLRVLPVRLAALFREDDRKKKAKAQATRVHKTVPEEAVQVVTHLAFDPAARASADRDWSLACFSLLDTDAALAVVNRVIGSRNNERKTS